MAGNRPAFEVADVIRRHGEAFRLAHAGHLSHAQLRVMGAIEACRTAALGGHVERCVECGHERVAANSCRDRHCPKCLGSAAHAWLEARKADLLPVEYFLITFTVPAQLRALFWSQQRSCYDLLLKTAWQTVDSFARRDPRLKGITGALSAVTPSYDTIFRTANFGRYGNDPAEEGQ